MKSLARRRHAVFFTLALVPVSALAAADGRHGPQEEILVTARPYGQSLPSTLQTGTILSGEDLAVRTESTLGETLAGLPGIRSTYFGPGASRPVIRGLGGDRVRILNGGIGSLDAASTSPDHAVALEPLTLERVEILRGPATLLYGSSAVGGVVNVLDGRIPGALPEDGVKGGVQVLYGTAANEQAAAAAATVGVSRLAIHADGSYRDTDDLSIPGFAESKHLQALEDEEHDGEEESHAFGTLPNSAARTKTGAAGLSYVGDKGFVGISYARNDQRYGVPGHAHHEEGEHDGEGDVRIHLVQDRFDVMGETHGGFLIFEKTKVRFGYADYRHTELEGDETGTVFSNKGWEGRLELVQRQQGGWRGAMGVQAARRNFAAVGAEAFTLPSLTKNWGVFTVQEMGLDPVTLEAGARFERVRIDTNVAGLKRDFNLWSLSAGAAVDMGGGWLANVMISRSERAPSAEELFSGGPHLATRSYEQGQPALSKEKALSVEAVARKTAGAVTGALSVFYTRFDDFIFQAATGFEKDGLPVFAYAQRDARFYGGEAELAVTAYEASDFALSFDVATDMVRASLANNGGPLPRIPPKALTLGAAAQGAWYDVRVELELVDKQTRMTAFELPTSGYALLNMMVNVHPFANQDVTLSLRARNLTNSDARSHTSFLKDLAPLPGRDIRASVTYRF